MKETRFDSGRDIRRLLSYMITDSLVCGRIASKWPREGLFESNVENLIGGWCVNHFKKYKTPPNNDILTIYESWAQGRNGNDKETVRLTENLLRAVSDEDELERLKGTSSDYMLDLAGILFNKFKIRKSMEIVEEHLQRNEVALAEEVWKNFQRVELGVGSLLDLGEDVILWENAFDSDKTRPLVTYPGILGKFLGNEFARDSFVVFEASSKKGKSWWLHDLGFRATKQRNRVLYFEAGDLSESQVLRRLGRRVLGRPRPGRSGNYKVPTAFSDKGEPPVCEERYFEEVTPFECRAAWNKIQRGEKNFKLSCHPNSSLSVSLIDSIIKDKVREGWIPDVVIIDYADILAAPQGISDDRNKINENWKYMRRISQEYHCLVVTATQADADSYDRKLLKRKNFSDDRRKHDHVTAMIGINSTDEEKSMGITRLNFLDRRDSEYTEGGQVWVVGNLDLGRPVIISTY